MAASSGVVLCAAGFAGVATAQTLPPAPAVTGGVPTAALPDTARARAEASAPIVSLPDAVARALGQSDAVAIARAGVTRARGEVMQARASFYPQLAGNASYARTLKSQYQSLVSNPAFAAPSARDVQLCTVQLDTNATAAQRQAALAQVQSCTGSSVGNAFGSVGFGAPNSYQLGLSFSQTLFNGQLFAAQAAASAPRESATIEVGAQRAQVVYDVAQAYYDATLDDELVTIADSTLAQDERTLDQARLGRRIGTQSEYDLLQSQVTRDNQVPVVLQRRNDRDQAYYKLKQLLKLPLDAPLGLSTGVADGADLPGDVHLAALADRAPDPVADTTTDRRSSVREQALTVREYEALLTENRAEYLPSLVLTSAYSRVAYPAGGLPAWNSFLTNWSVTVGASVPIFNGFKTHGDVLVAEANLTEQRSRLKQERDLAALDARQALANLREASSTWAATASSVDQARRAYQIAEVRYREGLSTLVELTSSRLAQQQSLANRAQAARNLQVARVRVALLRDLPVSQSQASAGASAAASGAQGSASGAASPATTTQIQTQSSPTTTGPSTGQPSTPTGGTAP
jgi:outer membrane protein TolC